MSMNANEQKLDLSDVSSFDDDEPIGLDPNGGDGVTQKTENSYSFNSDQEDFSDYINRTSKPDMSETDNDIAKYLKEQGQDDSAIQAATITTEDGEISIFDLDKKTQKEFLKNLKQEAKTEVEEKEYDELVIDADENIEALLEAYNNGGLDGIIDLIKSSDLLGESFESQVANLTDDELLIIEAKRKCPHCDDDIIDDSVEKTKQMTGVKEIIKGIRNSLVEKEKQELEAAKQQEYKELEEKREQGRAEFKKTVSKLPSIYDFENDPELVNEISDYIYNYDENYDTTEFLRDITTDPELRYKVAFFSKYGDQMIENYKEEIQKAYQEGKKSVLNVLPSKPKHSINYNTGKTGKLKVPDLGDI